MKVLKASAGSGKTYALSHTYIDLLLNSDDRYAYRHILAVTFTNKATAEMKSRILRDLKELSSTNEKARRILSDILHDYSAFSVSTIDKFFQSTLKAFSREIGQFASYQVELDKKSLINEAMDRILDGLTEDQTELLDWLRRSVMDKVEQGQKFSLDEALHDMGARLKNEEHRELQERYGIDDTLACSKERLSAIRKSCRRVIKDFEKKATAAGLVVAPGEKIKRPGVRTIKANPELEPLFEKPYCWYCTACIVDSLVFSLGVAGEFYKHFDEILKEKNVMPLDDSNTILRDIIDGSDAPFIYEKTGVRYEHFLLDEFQDTSRIQWCNFLPLLRESEAGASRDGVSSLIVGDVKQSIYRWRDSDWHLLGEEVGREFPLAQTVAMKDNWRSAGAVVDFNNRFFTFAANKARTKLYDDVEQTVRSDDPQGGFVKVSFTSDQLQAIVDSIADARSHGALWNDIAILVRNKKEGSLIAGHLIPEGIPVISDDSLHVKASVTVRRLVSLLSCIDNPGNSVGSYLSREFGPESSPAVHHSLLDLCEHLLRSIRDKEIADSGSCEGFDGETLFIQAFLDDLRGWVDVNGNSLSSFLKHWADADPCIGSPESADSIRILTIHKSKGLEFPYVIFPFAEKVKFYDDDTHWCRLDTAGSPIDPAADGIYPVELNSTAEQTLFEDSYRAEKEMQTIDNINVFYVALTRAVKVLHIISEPPSKTFTTALDKGRQEYKRFTEMLYEFCGRCSDRSFGDPYDFTKMKRKPSDGVLDFPATFKSFDVRARLQASDDARDFFGEDGVTGSAASPRLCGIELHKALESVRTPEDLDKSLEPGSYNLLKARIEAHPEWFKGVTVRNEATIIDRNGGENRPDRVVFSPDGSVSIIDYKFGEKKDSHVRQVARYMSLYRQLGHSDVKGFVWYVPSDTVITVGLSRLLK